jgi:hypothetical protein
MGKRLICEMERAVSSCGSTVVGAPPLSPLFSGSISGISAISAISKETFCSVVLYRQGSNCKEESLHNPFLTLAAASSVLLMKAKVHDVLLHCFMGAIVLLH